MKKVLINKIRCKKCNDIIQSTDRHNLVYCKCGTIFADGGTSYQKFGWKPDRQDTTMEADNYIDFSYSVYDE